MTTSEFIKIKKSGFAIDFKMLVGLKKSNDCGLLAEFLAAAYPDTCNAIANGYVIVNAGKFGISYQMYETGILKTNIENHKRTFYKTT